MSKLELHEFHSFLENLIEEGNQERIVATDKIIQKILTHHAHRIEKIQRHLNEQGLRVLIRNNNRAKKKRLSDGHDLFGYYSLGKIVSVPYLDEKGKRRWHRIARSNLSHDDIDRVLAYGQQKPVKPSKERLDLEEIAKIMAKYRGFAKNAGEALRMAEKDGLRYT